MKNRRFGGPRAIRGRMRFAMRSALGMMDGGGDGAGAGAAGGGDEGGGAGGGDQQQQQQQAAGGGDPWFHAASDQAGEGGSLSHRAWMANKNFASLDDAVTAYRNLEKAHGAGRFSVPTDWNDQAQAAAAYKALGLPEQMGDAYKLDLPEGADPTFANEFAEHAHKTGVLPHQFKAIATAYMAAEQKAAEAVATAAQQASAADVAALKSGSGWGGDFDKNDAIAGAAAKAFGLDVGKLAKAMGTKDALTFLYDLGKKTGEDRIEGGGARGLGGMTGAAAAEAKKTFMADAEKTAKLRAGDPATKAEWDRINASIAAEMDRAQAA